jgi:hypothetical protein
VGAAGISEPRHDPLPPASLVLVRRPRKHDIGLAFAQRVEKESDPVEIAVQRLEQLRRAGHGRIVDIEARFHQVHELAKAHCAGHPRAALERMERAAQLAGPVSSPGARRHARTVSPA